jgi:LysM repeat protein
VNIRNQKATLFASVLILFCSLSWAQKKATVPVQGHPPKDLSQLPDGHWSVNTQTDHGEGSQIHVVKAGDTLWEITKQYLKDPYLWPQVWEINSNIKNPHWIYPGDRVLIKQMVVMKTAPESAPTEPLVEQTPTRAVAPPAEQAAEVASAPAETPPTAPAPKPAATFSDVYCAGFFSADEIKPDKIIVGGEESESKSFFHDRDIIYVSQGASAGLKPGEEYLVLRRMGGFGKYGPSFARAKSRYGYYYQDIGRVKILLAHENSATAEVVFACEEINIHDFLVPNEQRTIPPARLESAFDKFTPPNNKTVGRIFMAKDYRKLEGAGHVVYVDVGKQQDVHVGDYFRVIRHFDSSNISLFNRGVYRRNRDTFDSVRKIIGEVVILRTEAKTSTALVTLSTQDIALDDGIELE